MAAGRRSRGRKGLIVAFFTLLVLLVAVDLLRSDSLILGYLQDVEGRPRTPLGRFLDEITP